MHLDKSDTSSYKWGRKWMEHLNPTNESRALLFTVLCEPTVWSGRPKRPPKKQIDLTKYFKTLTAPDAHLIS